MRHNYDINHSSSNRRYGIVFGVIFETFNEMIISSIDNSGTGLYTDVVEKNKRLKILDCPTYIVDLHRYGGLVSC